MILEKADLSNFLLNSQKKSFRLGLNLVKSKTSSPCPNTLIVKIYFKENYLFEDYLDNYAVWSAPRALNRNSTSTLDINKAINASCLKEFVTTEFTGDRDEFNFHHRIWAHRIMEIYLKTSVVLPLSGECKKSKVIHPPIDATLLRKLY